MVTSHLPETPLTWQNEDLDYIGKAMYLINKGYPVPTKDVMKLAKLIENKEKQEKEKNQPTANVSLKTVE